MRMACRCAGTPVVQRSTGQVVPGVAFGVLQSCVLPLPVPWRDAVLLLVRQYGVGFLGQCRDYAVAHCAAAVPPLVRPLVGMYASGSVGKACVSGYVVYGAGGCQPDGT